MLFTWEDMVVWMGMTLFEIWMNVLSLTVFLALLALQLDEVIDQPWWIVFSPLYVADALNAYFVVIVVLRMYLDGINPLMRAIWSFVALTLLFAFKLMLCRRLSGNSTLDFSEVLSPIFILLQLIAVRTRRLCRSSVTIER